MQSSLFTTKSHTIMGVKTHTSSYNKSCMMTINSSPLLSWKNPRAARFLQQSPERSLVVCFLGLALGLRAIRFRLRLCLLIALSSVFMSLDSWEDQMTQLDHSSSPRHSERLTITATPWFPAFLQKASLYFLGKKIFFSQMAL